MTKVFAFEGFGQFNGILNQNHYDTGLYTRILGEKPFSVATTLHGKKLELGVNITQKVEQNGHRFVSGFIVAYDYKDALKLIRSEVKKKFPRK